MRASLALQQFTYGLRRETGPFRPSLWLSSNGYFYSLKPVEGEVSRERFVTPTWFLVSLLALFVHADYSKERALCVKKNRPIVLKLVRR